MLTSVFVLQGKVHGKILQWEYTTRDAVVAGKLKSDEEQTNENVPVHLEFLGGILNIISTGYGLKWTTFVNRSLVIVKFNGESKKLKKGGVKKQLQHAKLIWIKWKRSHQLSRIVQSFLIKKHIS